MEATNFVVKKALTETLLNMKVKEVIEINIKDFKENSIRNAANKLKSKGYLFSVPFQVLGFVRCRNIIRPAIKMLFH